MEQQKREPGAVLIDNVGDFDNQEKQAAAVSSISLNQLKGQDFHLPDAECFLDIAGLSQVSNGWGRCTRVALCNEKFRLRVPLAGGARDFYEYEILKDIEVPVTGI